MSVSRRVLGLAACLALLACNKKNDAPPSTGIPPLSTEQQPADRAQLVHAPSQQAQGELPAGHPPLGAMDPLPSQFAKMPAGHPAVDEEQQATPGGLELDPKTIVQGVLRLDDKVKAKVQKGDVIFLVARAADPSGQPGPVLAVKRLVAADWPMPFELDGRDAMMTGTKLEGKVIVSARVDKDGDAISKNPGDVTGASRPLDVPASKVVVTLDTLL